MTRRAPTLYDPAPIKALFAMTGWLLAGPTFAHDVAGLTGASVPQVEAHMRLGHFIFSTNDAGQRVGLWGAL